MFTIEKVLASCDMEECYERAEGPTITLTKLGWRRKNYLDGRPILEIVNHVPAGDAICPKCVESGRWNKR